MTPPASTSIAAYGPVTTVRGKTKQALLLNVDCKKSAADQIDWDNVDVNGIEQLCVVPDAGTRQAGGHWFQPGTAHNKGLELQVVCLLPRRLRHRRTVVLFARVRSCSVAPAGKRPARRAFLPSAFSVLVVLVVGMRGEAVRPLPMPDAGGVDRDVGISMEPGKRSRTARDRDPACRAVEDDVAECGAAVAS